MKMKTRGENILGDCQVVGLPCYLFIFLSKHSVSGRLLFFLYKKRPLWYKSYFKGF